MSTGTIVILGGIGVFVSMVISIAISQKRNPEAWGIK